MRSLLLSTSVLALAACATSPAIPDALDAATPPREFRAVWVATVANIDWPSKPGLSTEEQRAEAIAILDRVAELNFNAVVFQVRPHTDALYASELEPWSYYLTGEQGRAPDPLYDPLKFWVEEAHARGLELHAWFNPYRANHPAHKGPIHADSVVRSRPELVVPLGGATVESGGYWWMDPALRAVQDWSIEVVLDVVDRYDVDGVHFDDYFYPYRSYHDGKDFPDDASYAAYVERGGTLARNDWRRRAVDTFIERLYAEIKAAKPWVAFGISPFGIWRPGHPPSIQGLDQYDVLYADAKKWLEEGQVDYFTPQLYWPIAQIPQSFPVLLGWWSRQNPHGRHLWPGTSISRMRGDVGRTELRNQIQITRGMTPESPGICLFSMKSVDRIAEALTQAWAKPALVPASPWLDDDIPDAPRVTRDGDAVRWTLDDDVALWVVYERRGANWAARIVPGVQDATTLDADVEAAAVRAVDRCGNAGHLTTVPAN